MNRFSTPDDVGDVVDALGVSAAVVELSEDGCASILSVNDAWARRYRCPRESLIGSSAPNTLSSAQWTTLTERCRRCAVSRRTRETVSVKSRTREISIPLFFEDPSRCAVLDLITDVADVAPRMPSWVASLAHRVNNPNHSIMLGLSLIEEFFRDVTPYLDEFARLREDFTLAHMPYEELRREVGEALADSMRAAERIRSLVTELRSFGRLSGQVPKENVELMELVEGVVAEMTPELQASTHRFEWIRESEPLRVLGDRDGLELCLRELLRNACEATEDLKGPIVVAVRRDLDKAIIEVRDEGVGIPAEDRVLVREPFYTTRQGQGATGLGLARVDTIVRGHRGEFSLTSSNDSGTVARIRLPVLREGSP